MTKATTKAKPSSKELLQLSLDFGKLSDGEQSKKVEGVAIHNVLNDWEVSTLNQYRAMVQGFTEGGYITEGKLYHKVDYTWREMSKTIKGFLSKPLNRRGPRYYGLRKFYKGLGLDFDNLTKEEFEGTESKPKKRTQKYYWDFGSKVSLRGGGDKIDPKTKKPMVDKDGEKIKKFYNYIAIPTSAIYELVDGKNKGKKISLTQLKKELA